jgi:hypothetical protein
VYLETLEKTMGRLRIGEENLHIRAMYIGVDKLDNIRFNKIGINNKKTIIDNYDKKIGSKDLRSKNQLQKRHY